MALVVSYVLWEREAKVGTRCDGGILEVLEEAVLFVGRRMGLEILQTGDYG